MTDDDDLEGSQYVSDLDDYEDYRAMNDSEDLSSRDKIVYLQGMKNCYVDIVNIDKYDTIIGPPFMTIQKIVLDVGGKEIMFPGSDA